MIEVKVTREKEIIKLVEVSGHSGYDELGKDIVCSAVSTAMYMTVGLLEKFNSKIEFSSNDNKPLMKLKILNNDESTNKILLNLVDTIEGIVFDYSDYLKIKEIRR